MTLWVSFVEYRFGTFSVRRESLMFSKFNNRMNCIFTPGVLQTIVICISVIIIVSCILKLISFLKSPTICSHNLGCDDCHQVKSVSYKFVIGILFGIVVILFSFRYYNLENLFDFLSFTSAIVSIILAVLTIIYTYYTQGTTTSSAEKIEKSSVVIREATKNIASATNAYSKTAYSLQENIQKILDKLDGISAKVDAGPDYVNNVRTAAREELAAAILADFSKNAPPAGCLLLYACCEVQKTQKSFKLSDIFPNDMLMYYVGFSYAMNSIGTAQILMNMETTEINRAVVSQHLESCIIERIHAEVAMGNQFVVEHKAKIDEYFL